MVRNLHTSNTQGNKAKRDYSKIFGIVREINNYGAKVTYKELLLDFTDNRTDSLSSLSDADVREFTNSLLATKKEIAPTAQQYENDPLNNVRRAIISQFLSIGRTVQQAKDWAENQTVNGNKKSFNDYNGQELYKLLIRAKKVKSDFIKSANKKLQNG